MTRSIQFNPDSLNLMRGFNGLMNARESNGNGPLAGLLNRSDTALRNRLGFDPTNGPAAPRIQNLPTPGESIRDRDDEDEEENKDSVELSDFVKEAAREAAENARKAPRAGETNQVFVSEDGRFEVSIDLQVRSDGSYDMELAVGFAQSQAFAAESLQRPALPAGEEASAEGEGPRGQSLQTSASALMERYVSYEQVLSTRDFEARIFFEQSKSVAASAEAAYGGGMGGAYMGVAAEVSNEFMLNVSISGADINNFNETAAQLTQFDDSGTLGGFLEAAGGVLKADSSNLGAFLDATRTLVDSAQAHVSSKLQNFFGGFNEQFGDQLESLGFGADYFNRIGEDVQKDLDTFFQVTRDFLGAMGANPIEDTKSAEETSLDVLEENLEQLREAQRETEEEAAGAQPQVESREDSPARTLA